MSPLPSQTPSCPFFPLLLSLILGYFLPSKKINFSWTIASLFEPCSCVFWNEGMIKTNPSSDKINSCSLKLQLIATTFVNCRQICQNLNSCGLFVCLRCSLTWYWKFHVLAKEIHLKSAMQIQSFLFLFSLDQTFRKRFWQERMDNKNGKKSLEMISEALRQTIELRILLYITSRMKRKVFWRNFWKFW